MNIIVHIERLILDGVPIATNQRHKLQAAFKAELTRLLMTGQLTVDLQTRGTRKQVPAGALELQANEPADMLGKKLALAIYKGIGQ